MVKTREGAVLFAFDYPPHPETFVIELMDEAKIEHAQKILSGSETRKVHISGKILKTPAPYNPDWYFHLSPDSITFFDVAIEVCDASIRYVAEHIEDVGGSFLPDGRWCPWGSRLLRELPIVF